MSKNESFLVEVWESYENNGESCVLFATEEQAKNHSVFEIQFVNQAQVYLSKEGKEMIEKGLPVWA